MTTQMQLDLPFIWPPPYTIRQSARAKRITLSISAKRGLEVVVPERLRRNPNIERIFNEKRQWIEKYLAQFQETWEKQQQSLTTLPTCIDLKAIGKTVQLVYLKSDRKTLKIEPMATQEDLPAPHTVYRIVGPMDDAPQVHRILRQWMKRLAYEALEPWLSQLSQETGLTFSSFIIRSQTSLWGSCTRAHKISLNNKLMFLPPALVRYILIHELCHIKHLNHSKNFWTLVQRFDPDYQHHRRLMRKANQYIPAWMEV